MARKPSITKDDFITSIEELESEGLDVTLSAIRQRIGGSYNTLSVFMKEYRTQQTESGDGPILLAPEAISSKLARLVNDIWTTAVEEANGRLKTEREAMAATVATESRDRKEALAIADQLQEEAENQHVQIAELQAALEASRSDAVDSHQRLAYEHEKNRAAVEQIQVLKEELQLVRQEREAAREKVAWLEGRLEASDGLWAQFRKEETNIARQ